MDESSSEKAPVTRRRPRPSAKRKAVLEQKQEEMAKRKRTFDDFFNFCNFVLAYEEKLKAAERLPTTNHTDTNSAGESTPSSSSSSSSSGGNSTTSSEDSGDELVGSGGEEGCATPPPEDSPSQFELNNDKLEYTSDDESWNLVTCFCRRPFAGRPMIECHKCQTWVHLFCAKIKKDQVPDIYTCPKCRPSQGKSTAVKQKGRKTSDSS